MASEPANTSNSSSPRPLSIAQSAEHSAHGRRSSAPSASSASTQPSALLSLPTDIWKLISGFTSTSDLASMTNVNHVLSGTAQYVLLYSRKWWDIRKKHEGWHRASRFDNVKAHSMPDILALQHQVTHVRFHGDFNSDIVLPMGLLYVWEDISVM